MSIVIDIFVLLLSNQNDRIVEILLASQVKHLENYLIAADDIETGNGNKVPIWLFGFLY